MKTLRYLLVICTLTIVTAMFGQVQFKNSRNQPAFSQQATASYAFYTTSTLMESGSNLPIAARNGVTVGANSPEDNALGGVCGPLRAKKDDPFGGETIGGTSNPQEPGSPVGEGMWVLLLMACGYGVYRRRVVNKLSIACAQ